MRKEARDRVRARYEGPSLWDKGHGADCMGSQKPLRASERVLVWSELHVGKILSGSIVQREMVPRGNEAGGKFI